MTNDIAQQAATLRVELELGVVKVPDIVVWADQVISQLPTPPEALIDLSLASREPPEEVRSILIKIAGDTPIFDPLRKALGRMHHLLLQRPDLGPLFARGLAQMATEVGYNFPPDLEGVIGFDDEYALADSGTWGSREDVTRNLIEFSARFRDQAS